MALKKGLLTGFILTSLSGCEQTLQSADIFVGRDASVSYSVIYSGKLGDKNISSDENREAMLETQLKEYEKKNERVSRACDVTMIPYVKRAGGREYFNVKIKGKVERYYGIQRVMKCVGSNQDAAMEVRRVAHLMSIEYQIEAYFELGEMVDQKSKGSDVELSVKSQIPEAVSIDVPGRIEVDSVVNLSKGFALNYIPRQVGDSVLEIRPKVQIANQELNRRCTKTNDYCRAERTKRDFIKVKFSAFDPRYDLPGLIGIGAGIVGIGAGVFGSGLFNILRRRREKSKRKS